VYLERIMLSHIFLGMSLIGAEWVLYLLIMLSIVSVAVIIERARFYHVSTSGIRRFREEIRKTVTAGRWDDALKIAEARANGHRPDMPDLETGLSAALLSHRTKPDSRHPAPELLSEVAQAEVLGTRVLWERNLGILATIGNIAPFVGLFGTVLGIIKSFHDLSQQAAGGAQTVTAGIAEALVATAIGILVAIPAVVAFNLFQRRVKAGLAHAEALKSFIVGRLAGE
jgi:biopolymer transport protein ExbB